MDSKNNTSNVDEKLTVDTITTKPSTAHKQKKGKNKKRSPDNEKKSSKKPRPNYFIGIRVSNPQILGKINAVQEHIKHLDSRFSKAVVPISTTHVTLAVFHLNDEDVSRACILLEECQSEIRELIGSTALNISLTGIGNFRQEVLFAKISPGDNLKALISIADVVEKHFKRFCAEGQRAFKPHVTIMKLSKVHGILKKKLKKLPVVLYEKFENLAFGIQHAGSMQLLSMLKKKQPDGYYHCECEVKLDSNQTLEEEEQSSSLHNWAECMSVSCITLALHAQPRNEVLYFSHNLSSKIMQDSLQPVKRKFQKEQKYLGRKCESGIKSKLDSFKRNITSVETSKRIRHELEVP